MITRENFNVIDFRFHLPAGSVMEIGPSVSRKDSLVKIVAPEYLSDKPMYFRFVATSDPYNTELNNTVVILSDGNGSIHRDMIPNPVFISNFTVVDDVIGEMIETFNLNEMLAGVMTEMGIDINKF